MSYQRPDLGPRGLRVWADLGGDQLAPAQRLLLEEICRTADRLDRLDSLVRGDEDAWISLESRGDDGPTVVVVNNLLAEARQQQVALKQMLGEFRQAGAAGGAKQPDPQAGGSFRDELRARRQARLADAAGS